MGDITTGGLAAADLYAKTGGITTTTAILGKNADQMGMDEFMNLLVAQMTNQDMMNPSDNTEFIAQMAQFSSLQGIKTLQEYTLSSYAASYAGKYVSVANINETTGDLETIRGVVDSVTFYDGKPKVIVNGTAYDLHTVMEINSSGNGTSLSEAAAYIGKDVELYHKDEVTGEEFAYSGVVNSVTMKDGKPCVVVDGVAYPVTYVKGLKKAAATGEDDS